MSAHRPPVRPPPHRTLCSLSRTVCGSSFSKVLDPSGGRLRAGVVRTEHPQHGSQHVTILGLSPGMIPARIRRDRFLQGDGHFDQAVAAASRAVDAYQRLRGPDALDNPDGPQFPRQCLPGGRQPTTARRWSHDTCFAGTADVHSIVPDGFVNFIARWQAT
jgi:hypothetical protein